MTRFAFPTAFASIVLSAIWPASAELLRDAATGLAIDPPAGYVASVTTPTGPYSAAFDVRKPEDIDTGCRVAFQSAGQNASLTQADINAYVAKPQWADLVKNGLASVYDVRSFSIFEHAGVHGAMAVADFKQRPDFPDRSRQVSTVFFLQETPKGRTTTVCVVEKAAFEGRRAEFETIARRVTLPQ